MHTQGYFRDDLRVEIEEGKNVKFCKDFLVANLPLKIICPGLYRSWESIRFCLLFAKVFNNQDWNWAPKFRYPITEKLQGELLLLFSITLVQLLNCQNDWKWSLESSGEYQVKSYYNFVSGRGCKS